MGVGAGNRHRNLEAVGVLVMRLNNTFLLIAMWSVAGCAGTATPQPPASGIATSRYLPLVTSRLSPSTLPRIATRPSWMRAAPEALTEPVQLFVSQVYSTQLYGYSVPNKKNDPPSCTYSPGDYVNNMSFDSQGNLWAPEGENRTIIEYQANCGPQIGVLYDNIGQDDGIVFDRAGHQWVANLQNLNGANGSVIEYVKSKVIAELQDPTLEEIIGLAMDRSGNVWVSFLAGNSNFPGNVAEFPKGKEPASLFSNISLGFPGSIQFDNHDNLVTVNQTTPRIQIYAPPYTGAPTSTFPLHGAAVDCTLSHSEKLLYCADYTYGSADVYAYPSGQYRYSFTTGLVASLVPTGVAVFPAPPR
jgi:hypothetical protein